jgi:hypothetical protein
MIAKRLFIDGKTISQKPPPFPDGRFPPLLVHRYFQTGCRFTGVRGSKKY